MGDVASVVSDALGLSSQIVLFVVLAASGGALVMAVLRVATRIDDDVLGFAGRVLGLALLFFISGSFFSSQVLDFSTQVWSTPVFYY